MVPRIVVVSALLLGARPAVARPLTLHTAVIPLDCAFATFLSGSSYVPGALCLEKMLLRTNGAKCPLLLMYDDRPQAALRTSERTKLEGRLHGGNRLAPRLQPTPGGKLAPIGQLQGL